MGKFHKIVKDWAKKGDPNCLHYDLLLDAEKAALKGKKDVAIESYQQAALQAGRSGFIHDQALANERLGDFSLDIGDVDEAKYRYNEAIKLYGEWGASRKVRQLEEEKLSLLLPQVISIDFISGDSSSEDLVLSPKQPAL